MLQGSLATVQIDIWRGSMLQGSLAKCTNRYLEGINAAG